MLRDSTSRTTPHPRRGYLADSMPGDSSGPPDDLSNVDAGIDQWSIHEAQRGNSNTNRPRLAPDVWQKLSSKAKSAWREIADTDKATIIAATRSANVHDVANALEEAATSADDDPPDPGDSSPLPDTAVSEPTCKPGCMRSRGRTESVMKSSWYTGCIRTN